MEMKKLLTLTLAMLTLPLAARQYEVTQEHKGFDKIYLNPGEAKTVSVRLRLMSALPESWRFHPENTDYVIKILCFD